MQLSKFKIDYYKKLPKDLEQFTETLKTQGISELQQYNPLYDDLFVLNDNNYDCISLNHKYHAVDSNTVIDITKESPTQVQIPVHFKYSPLLDPIRFLIGKYDIQNPNTRKLPKYDCKEASINKLTNVYNASYIDNFFCYLSSQTLNNHGVKHGIDYYGSYLGIQDRFRIDIVDDIEYLNQSRFFTENKGTLYDIDANEMDSYVNYGSRNNKCKLQIDDGEQGDCITLDFEEVSCCGVEENGQTGDSVVVEGDATIVMSPDDLVYEKQVSVEDDDESSENSSNNSELSYSTLDSDDEGCNDGELDDDVLADGQEEEGEDAEDAEEAEEDAEEDAEDAEEEGEEGEDAEDAEEDAEDADDEEEVWDDVNSSDESGYEDEDSLNAYIKNFPVQMICLEKCEGTLDEFIINKNLDSKVAASIFMQVIMSLIIYQKMFSMTHNDLHTNNIMYVSTDEPYLYYKYDGKVYEVPTYGKIYKIIDFGRAIYKYQGKVFCSDSFAHDGDASTQYNCEPFFNPKKPRLDPNMSFDLCRLGCSIYDFIVDYNISPTDDLHKTIIRWCQDDNGKNVLYKKNGEERYPNFKLYKMIARTVHAHTPEAQLSFPYFSQFLIHEMDSDADILNIDELPVYTEA